MPPLRSIAGCISGDPRAPMLRGLTKEYRKDTPVLSGIDLVLPGSGLTAIIGPSGTGKSTLIWLHQPAGAADLRQNPVSVARTSPKAFRAFLA